MIVAVLLVAIFVKIVRIIAVIIPITITLTIPK